MSGLVHLSSVADDFYVFDESRNHLIGRRTRRIIKLGDRVTVQIYKVDSFKKQVDFQLVSERPSQQQQRPTQRQPQRQPQRPPQRSSRPQQRPSRPPKTRRRRY
jgi:ribonuclease R